MMDRKTFLASLAVMPALVQATLDAGESTRNGEVFHGTATLTAPGGEEWSLGVVDLEVAREEGDVTPLGAERTTSRTLASKVKFHVRVLKGGRIRRGQAGELELYVREGGHYLADVLVQWAARGDALLELTGAMTYVP